MNSVEVRGALKCYGRGRKKAFVLNGLNMTVAPGTIFGLIGSSGCGKTTLLSCVLGMIRLDGGSIKVLGFENKRGTIGHRVGYMPQETALVGELTVKETVFYFGNIFQMNSKVLKERFEMIRNVLELPNDDLRVEECSGGEKRRISFASAIIHAPDLLILDEPTVGLDPILRERIWTYLWNETRCSQLSVIITTHYTMEAQKSDRVGLMREGVLIAEDAPSAILSHCRALNLDDAFLTLCLKKENIQLTSNEKNLNEITTLTKTTQLETLEIKHPGKLFRWQIIKEMTKKHYRKYTRQPALLAFTLLLPAIQLLLFYYIFDEKLHYRIAVVNDEIDYMNCSNATFQLPTSSDDEACQLQSTSCLFLRSFDESVQFEYPASYDEGYSRLIRGQVIAFLYIRENFSEPINEFLKSGEKFANPFTLVHSSMEFFIDRGVRVLGPGVVNKISEANNRLMHLVLETCDRQSSYLDSPLVFKKPIFGSFFDAKSFLAHSLITGVSFFIASCLTITPFITDRREGFWNRTLLAGVRFQEMIIAQAFAYTVVMAIINIEVTVYAGVVFKTTNCGSYLTLYLLLNLMGWCAIFFGMLLSTICGNLIAANTAMVTFVISMCSVCGLFYPIEIMREIFQIIAKCLPFTFPAEAIRTIMVKEFGLSHSTVQLGFLTSFVWTIIIITMGIWVLKLKKFSRNT